jgi:hypothetical protein
MQSKLVLSDFSLLPVDRSQAVVGGVRSTVVFSKTADTMLRTTSRNILFYVLAYLLWLVSVVVCIMAVIEFRSAINVLWVMTGHSRYTLGLADQLSVLLGGLLAFVYVVFLESYYRYSAAQVYTLLRRFAWTVAIPIGLLVVSLALGRIAFSLPR